MTAGNGLMTFSHAVTVTGALTGTLTGNADTATLAATVTYADNEATNETNAVVFLPGGDLDGGNLAPEVDGDFYYNPSTGIVTATGFAGALTGNVTGDVTGDLTGNVTGNVSGTAATVTGAAQAAITSLGTLTTLTVDDITINGNTISSAGASTLAITPTGGQTITFDGTVTLDAGVIAGATSISSTAFVGALTGNADTATLAATVTIADNEATAETNAIVFLPGGDLDGGNLALESDGDFHYNPSTGTVTATTFVGALTGSASGNDVLASADFANQGTTTTVLHGNAAGNPAWSAIVEADITLADNTTNDVSNTAHGFVPKATDVLTNFLRADGSWAVPAGAGDVVGPASSTDHAVARFDLTTGKLLQDSVVIADDSGNITGVVALTASGLGTFGTLSSGAGGFTVDADGDTNLGAGKLFTVDTEPIHAQNVIHIPIGGDIQTYVTAATAGDTLVLSAGTYTITSTITVAKQLNIIGQGRWFV
jgi:hypothetical protein